MACFNGLKCFKIDFFVFVFLKSIFIEFNFAQARNEKSAFQFSLKKSDLRFNSINQFSTIFLHVQDIYIKLLFFRGDDKSGKNKLFKVGIKLN